MPSSFSCSIQGCLALEMRAGDPPRTRLVLRVIAVERSLRGVLLLAAGTYLLFHLSTDFGRLAERIIRSVDINPRQHFLHRLVNRLHHLHAHELRIAGLAALGYGSLELVEGVGPSFSSPFARQAAHCPWMLSAVSPLLTGAGTLRSDRATSDSRLRLPLGVGAARRAEGLARALPETRPSLEATPARPARLVALPLEKPCGRSRGSRRLVTSRDAASRDCGFHRLAEAPRLDDVNSLRRAGCFYPPPASPEISCADSADYSARRIAPYTESQCGTKTLLQASFSDLGCLSPHCVCLGRFPACALAARPCCPCWPGRPPLTRARPARRGHVLRLHR